MSGPDLLTINTDGAARGNPGPAAYAYVIIHDGEPLIEEGGCLGRMTNNQAEYSALVKALEHAARLGTHYHLLIRSDSELMVKQMNGEYRVKDDSLRTYYEKAQRLQEQFPSVTVTHIRRAENREADRLCNEALDGLRLPTPFAEPAAKPAAAPVAKPIAAPAVPVVPAADRTSRQQRAREKTLAYLRTTAAEWARGDATNPAPEMVCHELWNILEKSGVLRRPKRG